jgi:hypothetical protein
MTKTTTPVAALDPEALAQLHELLQRAEGGDPTVLGELRQALDAHPELWPRYGDLGLQVEAAWLALLAGPNLVLREAVQRQVEALKAGLRGAGSVTLLEQLLVQQVAACWLQTQYADAAAASLREASPAVQREVERRQSGAQRRYLQALRTLATTRRLLRPAPTRGKEAPRHGEQVPPPRRGGPGPVLPFGGGGSN